jgi:hypothetical protein
LAIKRLIYVDTEAYRDLLMSGKFEVARLIGRLNREGKGIKTLLIGPGRWGSRDPSLGVPVSFAEINNISALIEVDDPAGGFTPELSFGSHFFLDLVETNIFYAALFMDNENVFFSRSFLAGLDNKLAEIIPEAKEYERVVKVCDFTREIKLLSDISSQKVVCIK